MILKYFKEYSLILSFFCLLLSLVYYDVVFQGKTFKITSGGPQAIQTGPYGQENNKPEFFPVHSTDSPAVEETIPRFIKNSLKEGILPLWNPHQGCGYPLIAMMQVGMFWPLNAILYFLPDPVAWDVMILCRFLLAGFLTFLYMRSLRFGIVPSLASGIVYILSGPLVLFHYGYTNVQILLPLILLALERLLRSPNLRNSCLAALAVSLTFIAGNPEHVFLVNGCAFLYFCFRLATTSFRSRAVTSSSYLLLAYCFSLLLAAFILFPFLRNWSAELWHSHLSNIGTHIEGFPLRRQTLISLIFPHFFQDVPVKLTYDRYTNLGFIGIIPACLIFISVLSRQKQYLNLFFAGFAFLIFSKNYLDFFLTNWLGSLPILNITRFYLNTQQLFAFQLSILAGMGLRHALVKKKAFLKGFLFFLLSAGFGAWAVYYYREHSHAFLSILSYFYGLRILLIFLILLGLKGVLKEKPGVYKIILLGLLIYEMFNYIPRGRVERFHSYPQVPYMDVIKSSPEPNRAYGVFWAMHPNTASAYGVDDLGIEEGLLMNRFVEFVNTFLISDYFTKEQGRTAFRTTPIPFLPHSQPYLDLLNLRITVTPLELSRLFVMARKASFAKPFYVKEVQMYYRSHALPRAFVVHNVIFEPRKNTVLDMIKEISGRFGDIAVIESEADPALLDAMKSKRTREKSVPRIVRYKPNEVVIEVDMKRPGFLILADTFHPDWTATVNGRKTKIYPANHLLRSVYLPEGQSEVRFRFEPRSFRWGLIVSGLTLLIVLLLLALAKPVKPQ